MPFPPPPPQMMPLITINPCYEVLYTEEWNVKNKQNIQKHHNNMHHSEVSYIYVYLAVIITKRPKQRTLSWSKIPWWSQHGLLTKHPGPEAQLAVREIRIASVQVYFEHQWRQLRMCCASSAGIKNINQRLSYCRQTTWTVYLVYVINDVIKHFVDKMVLIWLKQVGLPYAYRYHIHMNTVHIPLQMGFSWLCLYKLFIFRHISTKVGDKVHILLFHNCVKLHFKDYMHYWNINKSWRDCFFDSRCILLNKIQLEALRQCIPPPRHLYPDLYPSSGSSPKFNYLFIGLLPTFPENFTQIRSQVFVQSCEQTDKRTTITQPPLWR